MNHKVTSTSEHDIPNRVAAKTAELCYVSDDTSGIRREGDKENGFRYVAPDGSEVTDEATLERIRKIAFPPAYTETWLCPRSNGHLQATGRDAKGRKQYRYHARWRETRDASKYDHMMAFGDALPGIRARVATDLARRGLPREKVLATVVYLLETTRIRVGNEEYAQTNHHYGLTTLRHQHVSVHGETLKFSFVGKVGVRHRLEIKSRRLARIVRSVRDLPGQELFQYIDAHTGEIRPIHSDDVNEYLRAITGEPFTAKDFRTWAGTMLCAMELAAFETVSTHEAVQENVIRAINKVAAHLGNTPSVCRKSYIHPAILDAYMGPGLPDTLKPGLSAVAEVPSGVLLPEERAVLQYLRAQSVSQ